MGLDAKTEQMIALVMQINGYAKADDLQAIPSEQRAAALRSYYEDHAGASDFHWRGDQLWAGPEAVPVPTSPLPAETLSTSPLPATPVSPFEYTAPASAALADAGPVDPFGDLAPAYAAPAAPVGTLDFDAAAVPAAASVAVADPLMSLSAEPIVAMPEPIAAPVDSFLEPDYMPQPYVGADAPLPQVVMPVDSAVNPLWWVLAILWAPIGGVVAYLVLKTANPVGAGKVLKASLIVWGICVALGVVLGVLAAMSVA